MNAPEERNAERAAENPEAAAVDAVDAAVAASSSYELLKKRLQAQGGALLDKALALNAGRQAQFGQTEQRLVLRTRARTEHNCVARDMVRIGPGKLLFGFNVFMGLRQETGVGDVFALYELAHTEGEAESDELIALPIEGSFLQDARFVADFRELYTYYKHATLRQLTHTQEYVLASFQIGQQNQDIRVFRWRYESDGSLTYVDNRGERDIALPASHDFEWTAVTREQHVSGRHPHINILDTVFVETTGGDLTVKVENNTESGLGIYSEPVEDASQALGDAEIAYAKLGRLILLRIRPYRESTVRYLVYNQRTQQVVRIDAIGASCVQLPEDHGIIFPGGYYLQSGEYKQFDLPAETAANLRFARMLRSPNGEDVAYIFYGSTPHNGKSGQGHSDISHLDIPHYALFTYNLIEKRLAAPIMANGFARFYDGRVLVFQATQGEATRIHPMQLWQTPFATEEYASRQPGRHGTGFYGRVGNADLVRGISDLNGIARAVREQAPTRTAYEDLIRQCQRARDAYFWLDAPEAGQAAQDLHAIEQTAQATLAEFEKVEAIRASTARALDAAESKTRELLGELAAQMWRQPADFVHALEQLRQRQGEMHALRELRYADVPRIDGMAQQLDAEQQRVGERALQFLSGEKAFAAQEQALAQLTQQLPQAASATQVGDMLAGLDAQAAGLDLLSEQIGLLPGGDAVQRTAILDRIARLYADINRLRAEARQRRRTLGAAEQRAEFGAQFKLFGQAVENALELADTPEKCDEALTRLLAQLEDIEARFADQEDFLADIAAQREAVYEALGARRQSLLDARQRRAKALADAAGRILDGVPRRVASFADVAQVHSYFAADPLLAKLREQVAELRRLGAAVAADDLATRLKAAQEQAMRAVRDQRDLAAEDAAGGAGGIRLGQHVFTVNRQPIDLTLVAHEEGGQPALAWQITGTDYLAPARDERLLALRPFWNQPLASETPQLARAEWLAAQWLDAVQAGQAEPGWDALLAALAESDLADPADPADPAESAENGEAAAPAALLEPLRRFAAARYQEGYQRGIHDDDALAIVRALAPMQAAAGLLVYSGAARALALLMWENGLRDEARESLARRARAAQGIALLFSERQSVDALAAEADLMLQAFAVEHPDVLQELLPAAADAQERASLCREAAAYLARELAQGEAEGGLTWAASGSGQDLAAALERSLDSGGQLAAWQRDLAAAAALEKWRIARQWASAFAQAQGKDSAARLGSVEDAATCLACAAARRRVNASLTATVTGLRSEHPRITNGALALDLNDFWQRVRRHREHVLPGFHAFQTLRHELLEQERARLHLAQFQAQPLTTFVRNRLIDEVYLPLIGANLARQIGAAGEASRSDRSGLLLLISPPGYGKTTLMEYVAQRLGLVFVRINCPALGHGVTSIDPAAAPNSAARQELEKLNLGLAMGSNVMLYLDDIQHTHPEFLQKFIALADSTRRIEGVWQGQSRTWDMRGKRFAIVMAGNPYTESGEVFRIPDMLANRADIYNLGDVLTGREEAFALSYIENSLTSHPVTQPLASREPQDVQLLVRMAQGEAVDAARLAHPYSAAELEEIRNLLVRLMSVRDVLLKVNQAYIQSAAQDDRYRQSPPFRLQGSYRNMARLAPQVTPLMTPQEIGDLLRDHYRAEAQTLTSGAEENLLQLAQLTGQATEAETARWQQVQAEFRRQRQMGGADDDPAIRITRGLLDISRSLEALNPEKTAEKLARQLTQGHMLLARPLSALARSIKEGDAATQRQLQDTLSATAAALKALQGAAADLAQHSDRAQEKRMVEALLSLSVTYRQLIMPLVRGIEARLGHDAPTRAQTHAQIEQVEKELRKLEQKEHEPRSS